MGQQLDVRELRELLSLARKLRESAAITDDQVYVDMFLRAASALEERASRLAFGTRGDGSYTDDYGTHDQGGPAVHPHIDLFC